MTLGRIHYQWSFDKDGVKKYKRSNENRNRKKNFTVWNDQRNSQLAP
jgi:hypothetical protein